jgi:HlyD family secretion protein
MGIGLSRRRVWWLAGGAVVVVVSLVSATAYARSGSEPAAPVITTAKVDRGEVANAVAAAGSLTPADNRSLSFGVAGTVDEVLVRPGDQVKVGALLASVDDTDAIEKVDKAQDTLTEAQDALETAQAAQTTTADTSSCSSGGGGGGAAVEETETPSASPSVTPSATASATSTPTQSTSPRATASPTRGNSQPGGSGSSSCPSTQSNSGRSGASGDSVLRAEQQVTSAKVALAEAEEQLAGAVITAPIAGKVLTVAGEVGSKASTGTAFVTLGDVDDMQVAAKFPEADAGRLVIGLKATVTLADRVGVELPAKVTQVDPVGTVDSGMVRYGTLLAFDEVPTDLLVGQTAHVRIEIASVAGVLRAPSTAVHGVSGGTGTVKVRTATGDVERQVGVGVRGDQFTEITSGLSEGDEVITQW